MALSTLIFALTLLPEVRIFQEYLRIPSVHPNPNYIPCVEFLQRQADRINLPILVTYPGGPDKPVVVISWIGTDPNLPSILLNSHMDVVPVIEEQWTYPPFGAYIDQRGNIYARGTQDIKANGIQYLEAVKRLNDKHVRLKRTVHILFVPDEEIGGVNGMAAFIKTNEFKNLNVGFGLDEATGEPTEIFRLFYSERVHWQIKLHCHGPTGHASLFFKDTAGEKLNKISTKFLEYRKHEMDRLERDTNISLAEVTTINLTVLKGGEQINVVPGTLSVSFDIRLAIDVSHDEFEAMIVQWCEEVGGNIDIEFIHKEPFVEPTKIDESNLYWIALRDTFLKDLNRKIRTEVAPYTTDSRFLRNIGIPVIGFSPKDFTPELQHGNDEFINVEIFLKGIEIYEKILLRVANVN